MNTFKMYVIQDAQPFLSTPNVFGTKKQMPDILMLQPVGK